MLAYLKKSVSFKTLEGLQIRLQANTAIFVNRSEGFAVLFINNEEYFIQVNPSQYIVLQ